MAIRAIRMDPRDNVAIVTQDAGSGELVDAEGSVVRAVDPIPRGQKVALKAIPAGEPVYRYGEEIGVALSDISQGQYVHTHNLGGRK